MDERIDKLLLDVLRATAAIQQFTQGADLARFTADDMMRSAVERQFEIVGESLSRMRKIDPAYLVGIADHEKIIGFRNVLAHAYDVVQDGITWDIVIRKVPRLIADIHAMQRGGAGKE